jgi:hypothetical protein
MGICVPEGAGRPLNASAILVETVRVVKTLHPAERKHLWRAMPPSDSNHRRVPAFLNDR